MGGGCVKKKTKNGKNKKFLKNRYKISGSFTPRSKLIDSLKLNIIFYVVVKFVLFLAMLIGFLYLLFTTHLSAVRLVALAQSFGNLWGLSLAIITVGYGLVEIPRFFWYHSNYEKRIQYLQWNLAQLENEKDEAYDRVEEYVYLFQCICKKYGAKHAYLKEQREIVSNQLKEHNLYDKVIAKPDITQDDLKDKIDQEKIDEKLLAKIHSELKIWIFELERSQSWWLKIAHDILVLQMSLQQRNSLQGNVASSVSLSSMSSRPLNKSRHRQRRKRSKRGHSFDKKTRVKDDEDDEDDDDEEDDEDDEEEERGRSGDSAEDNDDDNNDDNNDRKNANNTRRGNANKNNKKDNSKDHKNKHKNKHKNDNGNKEDPSEESNLDLVLNVSQIRPSSDEMQRLNCCSKMYWYAHTYLIPLVQKAFAVFLALLSLAIIWSEIALAFDVRLSIFSIVTNDTNACSLFSLWRLHLGQLYHMHSHQLTDDNSLLTNATFSARLMFPLGYNFILLCNTTKQSSYSKLFTQMEKLPLLGNPANTFLPLLIFLFCLATWFNVYGRVLKCLRISRFEFGDPKTSPDVAQQIANGQELMHKFKRTLKSNPELREQFEALFSQWTSHSIQSTSPRDITRLVANQMNPQKHTYNDKTNQTLISKHSFKHKGFLYIAISDIAIIKLYIFFLCPFL
ncbi:Nucleolar protein Nop52 [Reticulomyxa filosa]|uniref:Nucleolar protein Nop52 n=1 Tax=Reticulomyxa filosa TaxID=46433 RepID=X6NGI6_RETFI|nr:Nucleolar protein Nop52 [Reticulomyxa filosa]|eukprot:ETO25013.1 Nucleolar protein Nop52 [Reticulomyxa filosa]